MLSSTACPDSSGKSRKAGKSFLQTLFFFVLVTQISFAQWEWQNPLPQGNDINNVDFIDENNGIAVGATGTIIRTTDGGISWTRQESGTTLNLNGVNFLDINNAWAVGGSYFFPSPVNFEGIILRTTNGGLFWTQQYFSDDFMFNGVCFLDANNGWVVGGNFDTSIVLHTSNAGTDWIQQPCNGNTMLKDVCFTDINTGTAVGGWNILKTSDGGNNWVPQTLSVFSDLEAVNFVDQNIGWAVGGLLEGRICPTILFTSDGGTTWTAQMDTLDARLYGVSFLDSNIGIAVGQTPDFIPATTIYSGIVLRTTNGGTSWTIIDVPINTGWHSGFKDFCFTNEGNGVLVGNYGVILKSYNDGTIWDLKLNGTMNDLRGLAFTNASNGFAVGAEGTILRTTNSGATWTNQPSETSLQLNDICFADENNGWIVGTDAGDWGDNDSSIILHTTNSGATWAKQASWGGSMHLYDLYFVDANIGWIVGTEGYGVPGYQGVILKTIDGGVNWNKSIIGNSSLWSIFFVNENTGWAVGRDDTILKTTNGGTSWITQTAPHNGGHHSVFFIDENNGWVNGGTHILYTNNGGNSWILQIPYNSANSFSSIKFIDTNNGWILSNDFYNQGSQILRTSNGGTHWSPLSLGTHRWLNEFYFEDINNGWIVGENGTILHTTNGGVSFVEEKQIYEIPTEFLLSQNYPNPFNPTTKIKYSVPQSSQVQIKVFDVLGNEIETLGKEEKPAGTYELTWNAVNLPSGVYFYQLNAGSFIETKKMILMK